MINHLTLICYHAREDGTCGTCEDVLGQDYKVHCQHCTAPKE